MALVQAGALINNTGMTVRKFLDHYAESRAEVLRMLPSIGNRENDHHGSILTTWKVSLDQLVHCKSLDQSTRKLYGNAAKLLFLFGQLDARDIWYGLIQRGLLDPKAPQWLREVAGTELSFLNTIRVLTRYSFVTADRNKSIYSMHNIFHDYCQEYTMQLKDTEFLRIAISIVGYSVPANLHPERWKVARRILPHANIILHSLRDGINFDVDGLDYRSLNEDQVQLVRRFLFVEGIQSEVDVTIHPLCNIALLFRFEGELDNAVTVLKSGLQRLQASFGPEDLMVLILERDLGWIYYMKGEEETAEFYCKKSFNGLCSSLGETSRDALMAATCLMAVSWLKGNHSKAREECEKILHSYINTFGPEDFGTIRTMRNQAENYRGEDETKAGSYLKDALEVYERKLGPGHPETLEVAVGYARTLESTQNFAESNTYKERALAGFRACFGLEHEKTLELANELAFDYASIEKLDDCERIRMGILEAFRSKTPRDFYGLANALDDVSDVYIKRDMFMKAIPFMNEELKLILEQPGLDSIPLNNLRHDLGVKYRQVHHFPEAESLLTSSLVEYEKRLDANHIKIVNNLISLADVYISQCDTIKCLPILTRVVSILSREDMEDKNDSMARLASIGIKYIELGMFQDALLLLEKSYRFFTEHNGPKNFNALVAGYQIGICFRKLKDFDRAKKAFGGVVEMMDQVGGDCKGITIDALCDLGSVYDDEGNSKEGEETVEKALQMYRDLQKKR